MTTALTTAFTAVKTSVTSGVGVALPIGLGIVAMTFGIKYVVRFFKAIARG